MNLAQKIKSQIENNRLERNKEVREKLLKDVETVLLEGKTPVIFPRDKSLTWSGKEGLSYYDGCLEDLNDNGFIVEPVPFKVRDHSQDPFFSSFLFPYRFPTITYTAYKVKLPPD